jgi:hypothetical protein
MDELVLNRLDITGILDEKTPYCVLQEIKKAHNIPSVSFDETNIKFSYIYSELTKINLYRPTTLLGSLDSNLRYIATFVNPECKTWTKRSLLEAYEHLLHFEKENIEMLKSITYVQKDRDNIKGFNACMLYSLCKKYCIETHWKMKPDHMTNLLQKLTIDTVKLRTNLIPLIENLNKSQLINIYALLDKNTKKNISLVLPDKDSKIAMNSNSNIPMVYLDNEKLIQYHKIFNDHNYLLLNLQPKNHFEAIVLAAMIYTVNITESRFPLLEFEELNETKNIELYVPIDSIFRKRYLHNKSWYNLSINYCPQLSFIYSQKDLLRFCTEEGYSQDDFRNYDPINLLHMSRISFNVYIGKNVYNLDQIHTPINLDEILELPNHECFTFGIISEPSMLKTYSIQEFCDLLSITKNYTNPSNDKETLSNKVVNKLKHLTNQLNHITLLKSIGIVEKWKQYSNEFSEKLRLLYKINKENIEIFLKKLLECAMYMRGWKVVTESFPMSEDQSKLSDSNLQFKIEENVFSAIKDVKEWVQSESITNEEKEVFNKLPLMKFSHEEKIKIFVLTPDPDDGTSILNRLDIVLDGNKYKNMKSCIRLSSNIILYSVYFYSCSLGLTEPFNIFKLDQIT